jgi:glutathione S-transferase
MNSGTMEFGSAVLNSIWSYYTAPDATALAKQLQARFVQVQAALGQAGPYFAGPAFSMVDAVFAPVFRYFDALEAIGEPGFFHRMPRLQRWREVLAARASVRDAVPADFRERLLEFLRSRGSELSRRMAAAAAA